MGHGAEVRAYLNISPEAPRHDLLQAVHLFFRRCGQGACSCRDDVALDSSAPAILVVDGSSRRAGVDVL
jgi:hypothetical protein